MRVSLGATGRGNLAKIPARRPRRALEGPYRLRDGPGMLGHERRGPGNGLQGNDCTFKF